MVNEDLLFDRLNEIFPNYEFEFFFIEGDTVKNYDEVIPIHRWIKEHIGFFDKLCVKILTRYCEDLDDINDIIDEEGGTYVDTWIELDGGDEYFHVFADFSNLYESVINGE